MKLVIRIGGSVVASPLNPKLIGEYADLLTELKSEGHELVVVVGGGKAARLYVQAAKELDLPEKEQDLVAIFVTRLVAWLLARKLGEKTCEKIPETIEDAEKCLKRNRIVVMGGLKPGMTTDTVAALLAQKLKADMLIKATNQDGIYTMDPKKHPEAKLLENIKFEDLDKIFEKAEHEAGIHQILDPEATKILKKTRMKTVVLNGYNPKNILKAVKGEKIGTTIQ